MLKFSQFTLTFCLLFALCKSTLHAQVPLIVKDYGNCTVGLQDSTGKWIQQPIYASIQPFVGNFAIVSNGTQEGLINAKGKLVVPIVWDNLTHIEGGYQVIDKRYVGINHLFSATRADSTMLIDTSGKILFAGDYRFVGNCTDSAITVVDKNRQWKFLHLDGTIYDLPCSRTSQPARATTNLYYIFNDSSELRPGYTVTTYKKYHGMCDVKGRIIVPPKYESVKFCGNGDQLIQVKSGNKTGYYNSAGKVVWACQYENIQPVMQNYSYSDCSLEYSPCCALYNGKWGVINNQGDTLLSFVYDSRPQGILIGKTHEMHYAYIILKDGKSGIVKDHDEWLIPPTYEALRPLNSGNNIYGSNNNYLAFQEHGLWGILDTAGNILLPATYNEVFPYGDGSMLFWSPQQSELYTANFESGFLGITEEDYTTIWKSDTLHNIEDGEYYRYTYNGMTILNNDQWSRSFDYQCMDCPQADKHGKSYNPYPYYYWFPPIGFPSVKFLDTIAGNQKGCTVWYTKEPQRYGNAADTVLVLVTYNDTSGKIVHSYPSTAFGDKYIEFAGYGGLMTRKGQVICAPGHYNRFWTLEQFPQYIFASTFDNATAMLDTLGNELFRGPKNCNIRYFAPGYAWFSYEDTTLQDREYVACVARWTLVNLTDHSTRLPLSMEITRPFSADENYSVFETAKGSGLIDTRNLHIAISPAYNALYPVPGTSDQYFVETCSGKTGIADTTNHLVVDTAFQSVIQIKQQKTTYINYQYTPVAGDDNQYLFIDEDNHSLLYSTVLGVEQVEDSVRIKTVLQIMNQTAITLRKTIPPDSRNVFYNCENCTQNINNNTNNHRFKSWQITFLFEELFFDSPTFQLSYTKKWFPNNVCSCKQNVYGHQLYSGRKNRNAYAMRPIIIQHHSDSVMSMVINPKSGGSNNYTQTEEYANFVNIIYVNNNATEFTLDSLFKDTRWEQIVTDSVLSYLRAHPGINADCSRPGMIPKTLNERFLIMQDGLYLYPHWTQKTDGAWLREQPQIIIPWKVLEPYLKDNLRKKIIPESK